MNVVYIFTDLIVPTAGGITIKFQDHPNVRGIVFVVFGLLGSHSEPTESVHFSAMDPRALSHTLLLVASKFTHLKMGGIVEYYQFIAFQGWNSFRAKLGPRPTEKIEGEDAVAVVFRLAIVEATQDEHGVVQNLIK